MPTKKAAGELADWLGSAMKSRGLNQTALAERSHVSRETIWRILHGRGAPSGNTVRRLAEAMEAPLPPAFDGARTKGAAAGAARPSGDAAGRSGRQEGWLWGDPTEAEQQFRALLHNLERTTRAMVGDPDLFSSEETKKYRLAVIRGAMHSSELAGRPAPEWLFRLYNEVLGGSFR